MLFFTGPAATLVAYSAEHQVAISAHEGSLITVWALESGTVILPFTSLVL